MITSLSPAPTASKEARPTPPRRPLFAERPEWSDLTPVPQNDDSSNPVAPIFYTAEYKDATDYFRGVVKVGEMSARVLELTERIIRLNPAHYSAWQYRYQTLVATQASFEDELRLMDELATEFLKTYQVWHHRRLLLTRLPAPAPARELTFLARALHADVKNYHTWAYRQWLLAHFDDEALWGGERVFAEDMLAADVRNNSAWHHRFFVVFGTGVREGEEDRAAVLRRELVFTKAKIALAPNNASAWNYLRGVLEHTGTPFSTLETFVRPYTAARPPSFNDDVVDLENPLPSSGAELPCVAALEFLADMHEAEDGENIQTAVHLWKSLGDKYDTVRKRYWEYRIQEATQS